MNRRTTAFNELLSPGGWMGFFCGVINSPAGDCCSNVGRGRRGPAAELDCRDLQRAREFKDPFRPAMRLQTASERHTGPVAT